MGAIFSIYQSHLRDYTVQEGVVEIQQNVRAAMDILSQDIRLAGYNPSGKATTGFVNQNFSTEPVTTGPANIAFTADLDGDSTINAAETDMAKMEQIAYRLNGTDLQRYALLADKWQTVAENIQAVEFLYTLSAGPPTTTPAGADLPNIREVTITLFARSTNQEQGFVALATFPTASGALLPTLPGFRYRLLTLTIKCRNMGL